MANWSRLNLRMNNLILDIIEDELEGTTGFGETKIQLIGDLREKVEYWVLKA